MAMSRVTFQRLLILPLSCLLVATAATTLLSQYQTRHLFVVIIDGLRNDEAFEDSTHQFIPRIWNGLRPQGSIYTELYSTSMTYTASGHTTIVTGTRNNFLNPDVITCEPYRPRFPTIFEYYRKSHAAPRYKVWIVSGKPYLHSIDHSLHPEYGSAYAATRLYNVGNDTTTMNRLHDIIYFQHPSLVLLNLRDVDVMGHTGHWDKYVDAIAIADSLVWDLWVRLQDDPVYSGTTTMLVTTDHGRHDNAHGGFQDHGGTDHGSEHVLFLAVGPDILQDTVFTQRKDLTDIAPTIGELLGCETLYAVGTPMREMIISPESPPNPGSSMPTSPSLASTSGAVHLAWSELDSSSESTERRIMYSQKNMNSGTWSDAAPLFTDIEDQSVLHEGRIFSYGNERIAVASRCLFEFYNLPGKPYYQWFPAVSTSEDGSLWSQTTVFQEFAKGNRDVIPSLPHACANAETVSVGWITSSRAMNIYRSTDGGASFASFLDYFPTIVGRPYYLNNIALAGYESSLVALTEYNMWHANRLLVGIHTPGTLDKWTAFMLDQGTELSFSPTVVASTSKLHYVWCELVGGIWQLWYRNSNPDGSGLSGVIELSRSPEGAQNPCSIERNDSLIVAWEDYRDGSAEIYSALSPDEGLHWFNPARLTYTNGLSLSPSIALWSDRLALAWRDNSSGYWEIGYDEFPLSLLGRPASIRPVPP